MEQTDPITTGSSAPKYLATKYSGIKKEIPEMNVIKVIPFKEFFDFPVRNTNTNGVKMISRANKITVLVERSIT